MTINDPRWAEFAIGSDSSAYTFYIAEDTSPSENKEEEIDALMEDILALIPEPLEHLEKLSALRDRIDRLVDKNGE